MKPNHRFSIFTAVLCVCVAALFLGLAMPMWGQATTATITGIISDPSGAPIVGATVTAVDQERGTTFSGPTNGSGIYNLQRLPAGTIL